MTQGIQNGQGWSASLTALPPYNKHSQQLLPMLQSKNSELGGLWRLVYSSGFARRNTGGARPGVPINLFPAQFGQVRDTL